MTTDLLSYKTPVPYEVNYVDGNEDDENEKEDSETGSTDHCCGAKRSSISCIETG